MRSVAVLLLVVLTGCASVEDLRTGGTIYEGETSKPVAEYGPCVSERWSKFSAGWTNYYPVPKGIEIVYAPMFVDLLLRAVEQDGVTRIHIGSRAGWRATDFVEAAKDCA